LKYAPGHPEGMKSKDIILQYYAIHEYVPPPHYKPTYCHNDVDEFDEIIGTDVPPLKKSKEFVTYSTGDENGVQLSIIEKQNLPSDAIRIGSFFIGINIEDYCSPTLYKLWVKSILDLTSQY
jgi:hypothetical protein